MSNSGPASQAGFDPVAPALATALATSCAFVFPVSTPPNAIVFGSGRIRISDMARTGFFINLLGVVMITLLFYILGPGIFGFRIG